MCLCLTRKCRYCGFCRAVTWDKCKSYWAQYTEAIQQGDLDARPVPEDCDGMDEAFKPFPPGTCPRLAICPSLLIFQEMERLRLIREAELAERQRIIDERIRRQREEFAKNYLIKRPIPKRQEPVPFIDMVARDVDAVAERQKEVIQNAKNTIRNLREQVGLSYNSSPFEPGLYENHQPENKTLGRAESYFTKIMSTNMTWEGCPEGGIAQQLKLLAASKGHKANPASHFLNWKMNQAQGSGSGSFVTTSGSALTTTTTGSVEPPREECSTPPTDITDAEGTNTANNVSKQALGSKAIDIRPSDKAKVYGSPIFPGFLGAGTLAIRRRIDEVVEEAYESPLDENPTDEIPAELLGLGGNDDDDEPGYDANDSEVGHGGHGHDSNKNKNCRFGTTVSIPFGNTPFQTQIFAGEFQNNTLVRPPPGFGFLLGQPKYEGTPPNFRNVLKPWLAKTGSPTEVSCLYAAAEIQSGSQAVADGLSKMQAKQGDSRFWNP